jgi:hypothetical protein
MDFCAQAPFGQVARISRFWKEYSPARNGTADFCRIEQRVFGPEWR